MVNKLDVEVRNECRLKLVKLSTGEYQLRVYVMPYEKLVSASGKFNNLLEAASAYNNIREELRIKAAKAIQA